MLAAIATGETLDDDSDACRLAAAEADAKLRAQCASEMADRIYGRAPQAPTIDTPVPDGEVTPAEVISRLEAVLASLALAGDRQAATTLLAALDPARYGPPERAAAATSDDAVDTVDFSPRVVGRADGG